MKTSLDLPPDLYQAVKVKAAQEGRTISDVVTEGIRLVLRAPAPEPRRVRFPLIPAQPGKPPITQRRVAAAETALMEAEGVLRSP